MTTADLLLLVLAGTGAGLVGSVAGLASLVSYPALLAAGLPPLAANVTNSVALVGSSVGSVAGSGPELAGRGRRLRLPVLLAAAGGAGGAALLLLTPPGAFGRIVPFLVAAGALALLLQPRLRALRPVPGAAPSRLARVATGVVTVYSGYFGAGAGVLLLAVLSVCSARPLAQTNAVKNVLLGAANGTAALGFALFGPVSWAAALALGVGCVAGGRAGPAVVRRVPQDLLRVLVALAGLGLAVHLWLEAR
ncbi:sulfite exporter TauE/SafE family protein [Kineococcus glutinatus]|uniref:Probable membrane transporter protein n=1 Tax=Kineococcus glutinatus TaxID=1070872 RepID=A0ABP9I6I0_9ACTN